MAQQRVQLDQDQFCCSVCLDLPNEPVTIHCGHSYCRSCIEGCCDQDDDNCTQSPLHTDLHSKKAESPHVLSGMSGDCCETHLQPHYDIPGLKKHNLVKATAHLQGKIFSRHDKLLDIYCRTDQQWVCYICTMDEHKGHDAVSAAAERTEKQLSAQAAVEDSERIFTDLIHSIERRCFEVKELIRVQEKAQIHVSSHWTRTQHTHTSLCLRGTES
ncbi:E3 ubiquitin-protein ligase TRIM58-like [Salvelinus alpinus]